jgi:uncharacterized protein with FMN-binding domain
MRRKLIIALVVAVALMGISVGLYHAAAHNMRHVHGLTIPSVEFSHLRDSTYHGSYSYLFIPYRVAVTIQGGRIADIAVTKNRTQKHARMAEGVVPRVLQAQNTAVDAVAGATTTSKALLMAVCDALTPKGENPN